MLVGSSDAHRSNMTEMSALGLRSPRSSATSRETYWEKEMPSSAALDARDAVSANLGDLNSGPHGRHHAVTWPRRKGGTRSTHGCDTPSAASTEFSISYEMRGSVDMVLTRKNQRTAEAGP